MAKDAKGHGSEKRGGSTFDRLNEMRKSEGYLPMSEARRGIHNFLDYMDGSGPMPDVMVAAKLAAGNPKAAKPPIHPGAAGRSDFGPGHTVSRITLGGKTKETMSGAEYAKRGGKFPSDK